MKVSVKEVERLAGLTRLSLNPGEKESLAREMSRFLTYAEMLREVDGEDGRPDSASHAGETPLRDDEIRPSLETKDVFRNAPSFESGFFRVPQVISGPEQNDD